MNYNFFITLVHFFHYYFFISVPQKSKHIINRALQGVLGSRGKGVFISGEQGNKGQILRGTGEQRQYLGTGNIREQFFDFRGTGEQANLFKENKGRGTPWKGLINIVMQ